MAIRACFSFTHGNCGRVLDQQRLFSCCHPTDQGMSQGFHSQCLLFSLEALGGLVSVEGSDASGTY